MPNIYREKTCPRCKKRHRKRGNYCSRECGNSGRVFTDERKETVRQSKLDYYKTPEGLARIQQLTQQNFSVKSEDFYINIPDIKESPFIEDGDIWEASDW